MDELKVARAVSKLRGNKKEAEFWRMVDINLSQVDGATSTMYGKMYELAAELDMLDTARIVLEKGIALSHVYARQVMGKLEKNHG